MYIVLLNDDFTPYKHIDLIGDVNVNNNLELSWEGGSLSGLKVRYIVTGELKEQYTEEEVLNSNKGYRIKSLLRGRNAKIEHIYANLDELEPEKKEADIKRNFNVLRTQIIGARTLESLDTVSWDMP